MNPDYTDITVVQDRSSSMFPLRAETIKGFNSFLEGHQKAPGRCTISLVQFNHTISKVYTGVDVRQAKPLDEETYVPMGFTALLDAIGMTIKETGKRLEAMPEKERPARVIFVITTDGEENRSQHFAGEEGRAKVFGMIRHQTERYNWQFLFLGANQDAIQAGGSIGATAANSLSVGATGKGICSAYAAVYANTMRYRVSNPADVGTLAFTDDQRDEQAEQGAHKDALNQ